MSIISTIKRKYNSICYRFAFSNNLIALFFNPFYLVRRSLFINISDFASTFKGKLLDVGCGSKPYRKLFSDVTEYIGLEIETDKNNYSADYLYDGNVFPFEDEIFDNIISSQVMEHVFNVDEFLTEIYRVLKPGGKILLTLPFVWDEHEQPFDFARYTSFGIKYLLEKNNFIVLEQRKSLNNIGVIFQLLNTYLYKIIMKKNTFHGKVFINILSTFNNLLAIIFISIFPNNNDLYMDNLVIAKKNEK